MTNDEKAEYFDQWKDYFEPLNRIRREVKKAEPNYEKGAIRSIAFDSEVLPELENLIQTMLNEAVK